MFRQLVRVGHGLAKQLNQLSAPSKPVDETIFKNLHFQPRSIIMNRVQAAQYHRHQQQQQQQPRPLPLQPLQLQLQHTQLLGKQNLPLLSPPTICQPQRQFHAAGSKVRYLDFRHRFKTSHLRLHLLIIRRQKMKKHRRRKWRRKFKCLLAKKRLKREIAKEKAFRVELLSMIRLAENFDPKEYALRKIAEINNKHRVLTKEERLEELKELIRKHRYQVDYIKPKHRRADI